MMKKLTIFICAVCMFAISGCADKDRQAQNRMAWLNSANPVIRDRAITQFGTLGHQKAAPALRKFLSAEYPLETRMLAAKALGNLRDPGSVDRFVSVLAEPGADLKLATVEALGKIRDPRAIQPLAGLLNDRDVQLAAIWALGNIGDTNAIPFLTGLLTSQDQFVRYNAVQALKKIGSGI